VQKQCQMWCSRSEQVMDQSCERIRIVRTCQQSGGNPKAIEAT
jgi:hypothetical protein